MVNNNICKREEVVFGCGLYEFEEINLGEDLDTVRENLDNLKFVEGINILSVQPGVGKTYKIRKELKNSNNFLITAPNHLLIKSEYEDIIKMKDVSYWEGFDKKCPKYLEGNKQIRKAHDELELFPNIICRKFCNMDRKKCPYKSQFYEAESTITVSTYYNTTLFYDKGEFRYEIAVIDEELRNYDKLSLNHDEINIAIEKIYEIVNFPGADEFCDLKKDFFAILKNKNLFSNDNENEMGFLILFNIEEDQISALNAAIEMRDWETVQIIEKLDFVILKKWLYYHSIYGEIRTYGEPAVYKLFDLARQGVKVVFSDATFSKKIFFELLKRYEHENLIIPREQLLKRYNNSKSTFESPYMSETIPIKLYTSKIEDKDFIVHNLWSGSNFHRFSIPQEIPTFLGKFRRKFPKMGIISYKQKKDRSFQDYSYYGPFVNFGALRGTNTLKNNDLLVIIGTPTPGPNVVDDYNNLFVKNQSENPKPNFESKKSDLNGFDFFKRYVIDSEIYQAIHRIRPFLNSDKKVFVFGFIPEEIGDEFRMIDVNKKETIENIENNYAGFYPLALYGSLHYYATKNHDYNSEEIAKEFKLYRYHKQGYNTKFVNAIRNGEINFKAVKTINKALLLGLDSVNKIKSKYKNLKIDDELIKYFIYYAKEGDFIKFKNW